MNGLNLNDAFAELCMQGLIGADKALIIVIAKLIWFSNDIPDLSNLPSQNINDVAYLVDRLARFNVVARDRKIQLISLLEPFKSNLKSSKTTNSKDALALKWGASCDLTGFLPDLLPLQTRHYSVIVDA